MNKNKYSFLFLLLFIISCSGNKSINKDKEEDNIYETTHFRIHYTPYDKVHLTEISDTLENYYDNIVRDLGGKKIKRVDVNLYPGHEELAEAVKNIIPDLPLWASGLATSATQIHMISPFHSVQHPIQMLSNLVHEFAHCETLTINPRFANNPRWLWESIAIYESKQFTSPKRIPYLINGNIPLVSELNNINDLRIYEIGYLLTEFIVTRWGNLKLKELIQNNGQLKTSLDLTEELFMNEWYSFVKKRYGL